MKLTNHEGLRAGRWMRLLSTVVCLMGMGINIAAHAQAVSTTTVQGTVYLANGQPGTGTLVLSWPSFTTASGQMVTAGSTTVTIAPDGFVSVNLAPNMGATPAGQYYTAVYYLSNSTTNTQYWMVPAAAQATLAQVQSQLMPAAQAVQAVSKAYVDQAVAALAGGTLMISGTTMTGPLSLCCDPTQSMQAADKHYVDTATAMNVPLTGASLTGPLTSVELGALYQADQFHGADFGAKVSACLSGLSATNGGTCDARNFTGTVSMGSNLTISTANATVLLPCATISTANQIIVTAGTRNVSLRGCALRGASTASGSQGGTVFLYSGTGAMVKVGDSTYAADTMGFHLDNAVINTTASTSSSAQGLAAYRTQEMDLESLYFLGNSNQTGMTLDGTGNYTGGTFLDDQFSGFQTAVNAIGHQVSNPATTDWMNASTFVRLHIDCPTSGGSPISGSYGINLQQGDGNTFTGGDVEGCATALHLGANAQNNTILGLRNENSTNQVVADAGSSYNSWMTGGTIFTGQLTDNGTRNSFLDTFHRSFNGLNGDWYGSQKDATVTNHYRLGTGAGNERGLLNEIQTDYGYRWLEGYTDATAGEQFYQVEDLLNNVNRLSIGQYNNGQSSTNDQTVINAAGTGAVVLNGSSNSGTGGVVFGSGGASESTVATINNAGNAQFNGSLQVGGVTTLASTPTVKNQADAEIDAVLWAGLTTSQKESFIYKDWNGNSQWYMVKDASNNWALNSATGGLDSFKAYQSTNSGDTYIDASNASGVVRVNYESGAGTAFNIYGGNSSTLYASFTGTTAIKFPGLAASSGHNCLQIDNSGYITNTGAACGTGSSNGTVNAGSSGQIAYYSGNGTALSGTSTVSITAGGTGASTASGALANLGGAALTGSAFTGPVSVSSTFSVANNSSIGPRYDVTNSAFGAKGDGSTDDTVAIQAAFNACYNGGANPHGGIVEFPGPHAYVISSTINAYDGCRIEGTIGNLAAGYSPPRIEWNGSVPGTIYNITGFTVAANTGTPITSAAFPANATTLYVATFTASNSLSAGQWVDIEGLTTAAGVLLNRGIFQVASATGTSFVALVPFSTVTTGTYTDAGTATTSNVVVAFDAQAHFEQEVKDFSITNISNTQANTYQIGLYFGSRIDTGSRLYNTWISGATKYSYYFTGGGINVEFDKGWRSDGAGVAAIYWKVGGLDSFGIANGTVDNSRSSYGSLTSGAAVMLDNSSCGSSGNVHFTSRNFKVEINTSLTSGLGAFTFYDCPASIAQYFLDYENTWVVPASPSTAGYNFSSFVMSPANDEAINLSVLNGMFPSGQGSNTTVPWVGIPALQRNSILGAQGYVPSLTYAPSLNSAGTAYGVDAGPIQLLGDVNVDQLWQYGIHASDFLNSDTGFAMLPNGTTLFAGQILAPPAYWSGANGKRYAIDVVYQTGTTGSPNSGATTCTGTSGTSVLTCSSATDLSVGQRITIGTDINKTINWVDATKPGAVLVNLTGSLGATYTNQAMTFFAPVLASEIQMPTKSSSAPTTLTWSQGDMEENSGATANGVAAWVNVAAGTPGTWAGIPLGNSGGQLATAQTNWAAQTGCSTSGYVWSPANSACVAAGGGGSGTVNSGSAGQIAYYSSTGTAVSGLSTTGSGSAVLATSPTVSGLTGTGTTSLTTLSVSGASTFGGSANTFNNAAAATNTVAIQAGTAAAQTEQVQWNNYAGTAEWLDKLDTSYTYHINDAVNSLDRLTIYQGSGNTNINAGNGANAVCVNCAANSGTGGLLVDNGAASPATVFSVSSTGNVSANGSTVTVGVAGTQTGSLKLSSSTATGSVTITPASATSAYTATLPAATDTIVEATQTQTLTNKSIVGSEINSGVVASTYGGTGASALTGYLYGNGSSAATASTTIPVASVSGAAPTASPTFTGTVTTPLTTAGVVTTTSGGVLGSVATTGSGSAVLATSPTVNGLTDTGAESLTTLSVSGSSTFTGTVTMNGSCTGAGCTQTNTPPWLMYLGSGADGANTTASGNLTGEKYYTNFTVPYGNTVTVNNPTGLTIHVTGTCTIAGSIVAGGSGIVYADGGGSGGGGGGGTAAGAAGSGVFIVPATTSTATAGGTAGAASGGAGGSGNAPYTQVQRMTANSDASDGQYLNGANGGTGGSSGGSGGYGGYGVTLICGTIIGTDGTHTGSISTSGLAGNPPSANSTGGGGGGGGGVVLLSSRSTVSTWPTIYTAGGPGALATVPQALGVGGSCTTPPTATLGVTSGALNGTCTVVSAGAGCGTGAGLTWSVLGGGGTLGTGTVNPTWSGGTLASCTTTAGTSSGYTAATYTTSGAGGNGGAGWYAEFQGW